MKKYYIQLTQGQKTLVDKEDFEWLNKFKWHAQFDKTTGKYTAKRGTYRGSVHKKYYMHRVVMDCPGGMQVDHINHDSLDNRKANLRICTMAQNIRNRFKFNKNKLKGASLRPSGKWESRITYNNVIFALGTYATELEAHMAYKAAAIKYHGEFACVD